MLCAPIASQLVNLPVNIAVHLRYGYVRAGYPWRPTRTTGAAEMMGSSFLAAGTLEPSMPPRVLTNESH